MKQRIYGGIVIISGFSLVISSVIYMFTKKRIPGLYEFTLSILMHSMFMNKEHKKWIRGVALLAGVLYFAVAVIQIYVSVVK